MKTGKNQPQSYEVRVKGRTFVVTPSKPFAEAISPAEFEQQIEDTIKIADGMGLSNITGQLDALGQHFKFKETTSPEEMDAYRAGDVLNTFMNGITFSANSPEVIKSTTLQFAEIYQDVRTGKITPEVGAQLMNEELADRRQELLLIEARYFHAVAETWAAKPGLTVAEACHGVAHDAYIGRFQEFTPVQPVGAYNPSRVYSEIYTTYNADKIKDRSMRAAKDLFGS